MKTLWIVLVTVIVAGGLTAEGTYYYLNKKATDDKKVLQTQIDKLNTDITTLNSQLTTAAITGSTATTGSAATASWKTYTNTTSGFTLKYPDTWKTTAIKDANPEDFPSPNFDNNCNYENNERCVNFMVDAGLLPTDETLANYITDYYKVALENDSRSTMSTKTTIQIGGQNWTRVEYYMASCADIKCKPYDRLSIVYFTIKNKQPYRIIYGEQQKGLDPIETVSQFKYTNTINTILSTFQFTK